MYSGTCKLWRALAILLAADTAFSFNPSSRAIRSRLSKLRGCIDVISCSPSALRVAVDLSFGEIMSPKEHRSVAEQLKVIYGHNRKHASPLDLYVTGLRSAQLNAPESLPSPEHLCAWEEGSDVTLLQSSADEAWPPEKTVWLSPDAEQVLELPARDDCIYVVAGIVDKSVKKGCTLRHALTRGAEVRRLPIREHVPRVHPILTPAACVQVLCDVNAGATWDEALEQALPQRAKKVRDERLKQESARKASEDLATKLRAKCQGATIDILS